MAAAVGTTHRQVEFERVHRRVEGPGKLVLPEGLQHHLEQVLQLIGLALGPVGVDVWRRRRVERVLDLPLAAAAAAARHLCCIQAVPHFHRVGHGLGPLSGSWS